MREPFRDGVYTLGMQKNTLLSGLGIGLLAGCLLVGSSAYLTSVDTAPGAFLTGTMAGMMGVFDDSLIRVNLHSGTITLFSNGAPFRQALISAAGNPYDWTATPTGNFSILSKERMHVSRLSGVLMPYSLRFHQGYYFHAIPLTPAGAIINTRYSHGCIRLPDGFIEEIFAWAKVGTRVEIYRAHLARADDAPTVYLLTNDGYRMPIATEEAFIAHGFRWEQVVPIPSAELGLMPMGDAIR